MVRTLGDFAGSVSVLQQLNQQDNVRKPAWLRGLKRRRTSISSASLASDAPVGAPVCVEGGGWGGGGGPGGGPGGGGGAYPTPPQSPRLNAIDNQESRVFYSMGNAPPPARERLARAKAHKKEESFMDTLVNDVLKAVGIDNATSAPKKKKNKTNTPTLHNTKQRTTQRRTARSRPSPAAGSREAGLSTPPYPREVASQPAVMSRDAGPLPTKDFKRRRLAALANNAYGATGGGGGARVDRPKRLRPSSLPLRTGEQTSAMFRQQVIAGMTPEEQQKMVLRPTRRGRAPVGAPGADTATRPRVKRRAALPGGGQDGALVGVAEGLESKAPPKRAATSRRRGVAAADAGEAVAAATAPPGKAAKPEKQGNTAKAGVHDAQPDKPLKRKKSTEAALGTAQELEMPGVVAKKNKKPKTKAPEEGVVMVAPTPPTPPVPPTPPAETAASPPAKQSRRKVAEIPSNTLWSGPEMADARIRNASAPEKFKSAAGKAPPNVAAQRPAAAVSYQPAPMPIAAPPQPHMSYSPYQPRPASLPQFAASQMSPPTPPPLQTALSHQSRQMPPPPQFQQPTPPAQPLQTFHPAQPPRMLYSAPYSPQPLARPPPPPQQFPALPRPAPSVPTQTPVAPGHGLMGDSRAAHPAGGGGGPGAAAGGVGGGPAAGTAAAGAMDGNGPPTGGGVPRQLPADTQTKAPQQGNASAQNGPPASPATGKLGLGAESPPDMPSSPKGAAAAATPASTTPSAAQTTPERSASMMAIPPSSVRTGLPPSMTPGGPPNGPPPKRPQSPPLGLSPSDSQDDPSAPGPPTEGPGKDKEKEKVEDTRPLAPPILGNMPGGRPKPANPPNGGGGGGKKQSKSIYLDEEDGGDDDDDDDAPSAGKKTEYLDNDDDDGGGGGDGDDGDTKGAGEPGRPSSRMPARRRKKLRKMMRL